MLEIGVRGRGDKWELAYLQCSFLRYAENVCLCLLTLYGVRLV